MTDLAVVLGVIGTVFGIWSINRQMDLEKQFNEAVSELKTKQKIALSEARFAREMQDKDIDTAILKAEEATRKLELYVQASTLEPGEYTEKIDPNTKQSSWQRIDDKGAGNYLDKLKAAQELAAQGKATWQ